MHILSRKIAVMSVLALLMVITSGCRESAQATPTPAEDGVNIQLTWQPNPPLVGEASLQVVITDANGQAVQGASVDVRGDMNHAGMTPVIREDLLTDANGLVEIPFEWTMGGDWFVVVTATLPDGTTAERRFDLVVSSASGGMPLDGGMGLLPGMTQEAP